MTFTVLILGGYGFFGQRLARRLALDPSLHVVIAGRRRSAAQNFAARIQSASGARVSAERMDATDAALSTIIRQIAPRALVHTGGPFQGQSYHVAEACIAAGVDYIDLADGREFVTGIAALDARARHADVLVVSGASSVPALSSAVVDELAGDLSSIDSIDIGISPGNRTDRGLATVRAGLSYCGAAIPSWKDGHVHTVYGWGDTTRYPYPAPVGVRWLSPCDVPDPLLFPVRYGGVKTVTFRAGLELRALHAGMNVLAFLRRRGLIRDWSRYAPPLKKISDGCKYFGSDAGAMHVEVRGIDRSGRSAHRRWVLVARQGDGPYVPTLASAALIRKLARGELQAHGAMPCMGLLALDDFIAQMNGLAIECTRTDA
jgi:saccharopine dehydrogenase-like NADP-dependent oxidoreductase